MTACLKPGCSHPAEEVRRFVLESTDGPVEHVKLRCLIGHWFALPLSWIERAKEST